MDPTKSETTTQTPEAIFTAITQGAKAAMACPTCVERRAEASTPRYNATELRTTSGAVIKLDERTHIMLTDYTNGLATLEEVVSFILKTAHIE